MDPKGLFILGVKLIGVYCLALAIEFVFHVVPWEFIRAERFSESAPVYKLSPWILLLAPVLLTVLGRYLMVDGRYVHDLVLARNGEIAIGKAEGLFSLALALYGVLVLAGIIPLTVLVVSKIVIVVCTASYIETEIEMEGIKSELLPTLATIGLGLICLYNGKYLTRLAFHRSLIRRR